MHEPLSAPPRAQFIARTVRPRCQFVRSNALLGGIFFKYFRRYAVYVLVKRRITAPMYEFTIVDGKSEDGIDFFSVNLEGLTPIDNARDGKGDLFR